jgi:hypothetical protein
MKKANWIHRCGDSIIFIPEEEVCPACRISQAVESLRHQGNEPRVEFNKKFHWFKFLFVRARTVKKKNRYEFQEDYYDRHG